VLRTEVDMKGYRTLIGVAWCSMVYVALVRMATWLPGDMGREAIASGAQLLITCIAVLGGKSAITALRGPKE
jgi:hypothetical protein